MIHIDMPMPEKCSECRFETEYGYCKAMPENFCGITDYVERPEWCPLKEQEAEWVYGEDETGVDGWHCSKCNFFEPWFYDFDADIDFIKRYEHCPKCGRRMTCYTGKQEGR